MSDDELERLKARRLEEMKRSIPQEGQKKDPRETVLSGLGFRGEEVLRNAEAQFPAEVAIIIPKLAELLDSGELGTIDGGRLLALFRTVGLRVRMDTKIKVEQDGKLVSLGERLKSGEDE